MKEGGRGGVEGRESRGERVVKGGRKGRGEKGRGGEGGGREGGREGGRDLLNMLSNARVWNDLGLKLFGYSPQNFGDQRSWWQSRME